MRPGLRDLVVTAWLVAAGLFLPSCGADPGPPVGVSTRPREAPRGKPGTRALEKPPPADLRSGVSLVGKGLSLGHTSGRWDYELFANEGGREALSEGSGQAPVGAKLVMDHFERATGEKGPTMAMEKREKGFDPEHGDWRWVAVGSHGNLVLDGTSERCWGCHDDAPKDHVFPNLTK